MKRHINSLIPATGIMLGLALSGISTPAVSATDPALFGLNSSADMVKVQSTDAAHLRTPEVPIWENSFGGNGFEHCYAAAPSGDGGYVLAGWTDSFGRGEQDMYLAKLNAKGEKEWESVFGGNRDDYCESVCHTRDGGYILSGYTQSFGAGDYDMYLVKTDSQGRLEWQKTFGGKDYDVCWSVEQTRDGGYILGGDTRSFGPDCDMFLVKTDFSGELEWQRTCGGPENDYCQAVHQTADGGFVLGGDSETMVRPHHYNSDMFLVKTDPAGQVEWQKRFGGPGSDGCFALQQTRDGGFILAGDYQASETSSYDIYLVKTDSRGGLQWQRTYGGQGWDDAHAVVQTGESDYLVAGYSESFTDGNFDAYLLKIDACGNTCWSASLGGQGNQFAYAVLEPASGKWLLAGYSEPGNGGDDVWLAGTSDLIGGTSHSQAGSAERGGPALSTR
jgi:hypothetical protein